MTNNNSTFVKDILFSGLASEQQQQPPSTLTSTTPVTPKVLMVVDGKQKERAIKNRQSAQASRERKRLYVQELESSRDDLLHESKRLKSRVEALETEKISLVNELSSLRTEFDQLKKIILGKVNVKMDDHEEGKLSNGVTTVIGNDTLAGELKVNIEGVDNGNRNVNLNTEEEATGLIALNIDSEHSPSALSHFLVSSNQRNILQDQNRQRPCHLLRLRVRYQKNQPITKTSPTNPSIQLSKNILISQKSPSMKASFPYIHLNKKIIRNYGSVHGKITSSHQKQRQRKSTKMNREIRRRLSLIWEQIVSGLKTIHKPKTSFN